MDSLIYKLLASVFAVFGIVGAIGAIAAIVAYTIFKWLGAKWLDNHFAERLEAFKHRQALEVEDARYRINRLFDRASKLHQYEYTHLPGAWAKLVEAFYDARASLGRGQHYAKVQGEPEDTVRQHMEAHGHPSDTIDWVMRSSERQKDYERAVNYLRLRKAQISSDAYMSYLIANQIFIRPEISKKFDDLGMLLRMALSDREFELEFPDQHRSSLPVIKQFLEDGERKMDELQQVVRDRLADTIAEPVREAAL